MDEVLGGGKALWPRVAYKVSWSPGQFIRALASFVLWLSSVRRAFCAKERRHWNVEASGWDSVSFMCPAKAGPSECQWISALRIKPRHGEHFTRRLGVDTTAWCSDTISRPCSLAAIEPVLRQLELLAAEIPLASCSSTFGLAAVSDCERRVFSGKPVTFVSVTFVSQALPGSNRLSFRSSSGLRLGLLLASLPCRRLFPAAASASLFSSLPRALNTCGVLV